MALQISGYVPPGTYVGEVIQPGQINIATTQAVVGLVGPGSRLKNVTNESILRGEVLNETLTVSATPGAHDATLVNRADRRLASTTVYRNGTALADAFVTFRPALILGTAAGPFDVSTNHSVTLTLDGKPMITIRFLHAGATPNPSVAVVGGTEFRVTMTIAGTATSATRAEIARMINGALLAASGLGYGASYGSTDGNTGAASDATTGIQILSPLSTPSSFVEVGDPVADSTGATLSALATLFGAPAANNRRSQTTIRISDIVYSSSAVYTADYVNIDSNADTFENTGAQSIIRVGSSAGVGTYTALTDYLLTGSTLDWSPDAAAVYDGSVAGNFTGVVTAASDVLRIAVDGRAAVDIDLIGLASPPHGYTSATSANATAAQVVANINAVLANNANYGTRYRAVASAFVSGGSTFVRLTSPTEGTGGSITLSAPTSLSAMNAVFGSPFTSATTVTGTGRRPTIGSTYFASYTITRPTTEYNIDRRFFSRDQAAAELGTASSANPLMLAVEVAFKAGAPSVVVVQVNDVSAPGSPTRNEYATALAAAARKDVITELIPLTTNLAIQIDFKDHVELQSSPTKKRYRRGWFGMPMNTDVGDRDTADTYVYRATQTFQVSPDSPGRGRYILVAPPQRSSVSIDLLQDDGSTETITGLDSTYLAVMLAAKRSSFTVPATSLSMKAVNGGFNIDDITNPWLQEEINLLAENGVMVVELDGGNMLVRDPCTTEQGVGALPSFSYPSTTAQKDNISRKVVQALTANLVGIVPSDLSDFIVDIKLFIEDVLSAEIGTGIGPFRDDNGVTRQIDINKDIEVSQDPNRPTRFYFKYFFFLRYPALQFFGEFSVDRRIQG